VVAHLISLIHLNLIPEESRTPVVMITGQAVWSVEIRPVAEAMVVLADVPSPPEELATIILLFQHRERPMAHLNSLICSPVLVVVVEPGVVADQVQVRLKLLPRARLPLVVIFGPWVAKVVKGQQSLLLPSAGGSGSGGSIYLKAPNLVIQNGVKISANGGAGANGITGNAGNSSDGGEAGAAAGGGGRIYVEASQSLVNHASSTHSNLTASGGQSAGARHGTDGTVKIIRPQVSSLTFTTGTLTIDTDNAEINHSDGSFLAGTLEDKSVTLADSTVLTYKVCVFTADSISIGSGVVVNLTGKNALSLRTRNNGNLTIGTQFIANGGSVLDHTIPAIGKLGGFDGGARDADGMGPGGGLTKYNSERGGSAGYGGMGFSNGDATRGNPYGDAELTHLLGGSGGGGGNTRTGGAGGGAIELIAHGDGVLTLTTSAKISVNGGDADIDNYRSGGAGSGGAIRLQGGSISCLGTLEAKSSPSFAIHAGGGGPDCHSNERQLTSWHN
jgi:hypothetical protein